MDGLLMFAKYAFPPNILQFCGPNESGTLFEIMGKGNLGAFSSDKDINHEFKKLLLQFNGAFPYLRLISQSNGIKDEFDKRVVEAYWLGNNLLENVEIKDIYLSVESRFRKMMKQKDWFWLSSQSAPKAKPFHGFHVLDIFRRTGLLRSANKANLLGTMDKCRIAWGRVEVIDLSRKDKNFPSSGIAMVEYPGLEFYNGKLRVGENKFKKFFLLNPLIKNGDEVSLHWDYICDRITPYQKKNLIKWTNYHLRLANQTI